MNEPRSRPRRRRPLLKALAPIAPPLIRLVGRFLVWSCRIEYRGDASLRARWARGEQAIVAFWHGRLLLVPMIASAAPMCIMVSQHRDGEMVTNVLRTWGVTTVRGSATRGAVGGFLSLVHAYRHGQNLAILPDGPRGPRCVAKPGVVHLARSLGAPIYPMACAASRFIRLRSWDRLIVPWPFARILVEVGEPLSVPVHADAQQLEGCRLELERTLNALTEAVDAKVAHSGIPDPVRAA